MNYRLFLILLLFTCVTFAQKKDSLLYKKIFEYSSLLKSNSNFDKARYFFSKKEWDSTLVYTQEQLNKGDKDYNVIELSNYFRGVSFAQKGIYNKALNYLNQVSNKFEFQNVKEFYLGYVYMSLQEYEKALGHFLPLSELSIKYLEYLDKNTILRNIGTCYLVLKQFDKSESYFKKSYLQLSDSIQVIESYVNIASLYYNQYKDNLAIPYYEKAYELSKQLKIDSMGLSYSELNDKKKEIYDYNRIVSKNMAIVEENRKSYNKALVYRKEMEKWVDSLNNQNTIYAVAEKEKEIAVQQKQKEVDLLQVKNQLQETQRNIFLCSAVGLLILLGGSLYFYREKVKRNKIIAHQKEDLDALNATKDKLFSIVSHDLRSSVNALKSSNVVLLDNLASKNIDALGNLLKKNSAIVNGAYGLLDNLLHWALSQTKQVYFEIKSTRLFFMVEQMAYNYKPLMLEKNIHFENKVSKKDLVLADQESLKLIIRNLLDNAIKFSNKDGEIKVYSRNVQEGFCDLIIEDTGMGMTNETRLKLLEDTLLLSKKEHEDAIGTGLGLQLCKTMVKKNNGKFSIESELGMGTKMIVSLPKKQDNG